MTEISLWWLLCYGGWGGSKRHHCDFFNHFQTYQPNRLCTSLWMPWMKNKFRLLSLKFEGFERSRFYYSYVKLSSFSCFNVSLRLFLLFFLTLPMQYVFLFKNRMLCLIAIHPCNFFFFFVIMNWKVFLLIICAMTKKKKAKCFLSNVADCNLL